MNNKRAERFFTLVLALTCLAILVSGVWTGLSAPPKDSDLHGQAVGFVGGVFSTLGFIGAIFYFVELVK